jgi:membrane protease YdiL (CAAX protease family)
MSFADSIFLVTLLTVLLLVEPLLGRRIIAKLEGDLARGVVGARMGVYRRNLVLQWSMSALFLVWWLALGRTPFEAGLRLSTTRGQWIAVGICLAVTVLFSISTLRASRDAKSLEKVRGQIGRLVSMVPHTSAEMRRFTWVSVTAGICEELIYRGLLLTMLTALVGLWPAVLLSSVAFGIGHAYQGAGGVARTGLVGVIMALAAVFSGSLFVVMLMHAVLDIVQGRLIFAAMTQQPPRPEAEVACEATG